MSSPLVTVTPLVRLPLCLMYSCELFTVISIILLQKKKAQVGIAAYFFKAVARDATTTTTPSPLSSSVLSPPLNATSESSPIDLSIDASPAVLEYKGNSADRKLGAAAAGDAAPDLSPSATARVPAFCVYNGPKEGKSTESNLDISGRYVPVEAPGIIGADDVVSVSSTVKAKKPAQQRKRKAKVDEAEDAQSAPLVGEVGGPKKERKKMGRPPKVKSAPLALPEVAHAGICAPSFLLLYAMLRWRFFAGIFLFIYSVVALF